MTPRKKYFTPFRVILLAFMGTILLGTLLLMLPVSSKDGAVTPFMESLFTATSATCVTGLVVHDTATYWSLFGQIVILVLIQIGGLGVVTIATMLLKAMGVKIGLAQSSTMQSSISAPDLGGIVNFTFFAAKITLIIEATGALIMSPVFCKEFGIGKGIYYSLFHSISAFCNAGFDLMGVKEPFSSLTYFAANPVINIVITLLIVMGGIGFFTWSDIKKFKFRFKKYHMQSKVIIVTTLILIIVPFLYYLTDFHKENIPVAEKIFTALFQSVTPRTAGFNTMNLGNISGTGLIIMTFLMLIGGSPGSTAGGMKTTTVAVLIANASAVFHRRKQIKFFGRGIDIEAVKSAVTLALIYPSLCLLGAFIISHIESIPVTKCIFETASAIGTVGLTLGITASLGTVSRLILILFMFFGRVGSLTIIYAAVSARNANVSTLPPEKIMIG